jgi:drug/metabolite transporter (DMT)-like permease
MHKKKAIFANLEMMIATIIWGSTFIVIKQSLIDVHAITLNFYRFALAATVIGLALMLLRKNLWQHAREGFILGGLLFVFYITQTLALYSISASNSGFIVGMSVIFVLIFGVILGHEKLHLNNFVAISLVSIGLWNITGGVDGVTSGELLTVLSAISFALYVLYANKVVKRCDLWVLNFQQFLFVALASLAIIFVFKLPFNIASSHAVYGVIYLSLFATMLAYGLQLRVQKIMLPVACAIILALEPIFAAVFAWFVGGEVLTTRGMIGGLLIVFAIIFSQVLSMKRKPKEALQETPQEE